MSSDRHVKCLCLTDYLVTVTVFTSFLVLVDLFNPIPDYFSTESRICPGLIYSVSY